MCSVNDGNDIELLEWLGWVVMTRHLNQPKTRNWSKLLLTGMLVFLY